MATSIEVGNGAVVEDVLFANVVGQITTRTFTTRRFTVVGGAVIGADVVTVDVAVERVVGVAEMVEGVEVGGLACFAALQAVRPNAITAPRTAAVANPGTDLHPY